MPRLENWSIVQSHYHPYQAPEVGVPALRGNIFDDDRFIDGSLIVSSYIAGKRGDKIVTRSGSEYTLGSVDPDYEKEFPDALNRLMKCLKEVE